MLVKIVRDITLGNTLYLVGQSVDIPEDMYNRCGEEYFAATVQSKEIVGLNKMVTGNETKPVLTRGRGRPRKE